MSVVWSCGDARGFSVEQHGDGTVAFVLPDGHRIWFEDLDVARRWLVAAATFTLDVHQLAMQPTSGSA